jgi:hypothetical protein
MLFTYSAMTILLPMTTNFLFLPATLIKLIANWELKSQATYSHNGSSVQTPSKEVAGSAAWLENEITINV